MRCAFKVIFAFIQVAQANGGQADPKIDEITGQRSSLNGECIFQLLDSLRITARL